MYRIVNAADSVTMLPLSSELVILIGWVAQFIPTIGQPVQDWIRSKFGGYMHGGDMRYLTNSPKGDYKGIKLLYSVSWFYRIKAFVIRELPWRKFLSDHSISVYRKKLFIVARKRNQAV